MRDIVGLMASGLTEAANHALTAVVLILVLPLLATAFIAALVCDMLTPRRESPWDRPQPLTPCSTTGEPETGSSFERSRC